MTRDDLVNFLGIVLIVLLPIIPAFLLYKYLPGKASAKGPLRVGPLKLNLQFTGAFVGYLFIFVILFFFAKPQPTPYYQRWTITGSVGFEGTQPGTPENTIFFIRPPAPVIFPDGTFIMEIETSVPPSDATFPSLLLEYPGFHKTSVSLHPRVKPKFGSKNYEIDIDYSKNTIKVNTPIILTDIGARQ